MERKGRRFGAEEKAKVLRRHLVDKVPVSELCEEYGIQPTVFYRWQKQLFEGAAALFERQSPKKDRREAERVAALEAKLRKKDEVLGELMEEHVALKKSLGEI
jgi:transposase-like protein